MCIERNVRVSFLFAAFHHADTYRPVHQRNNPKSISNPIPAIGIGIKLGLREAPSPFISPYDS